MANIVPNQDPIGQQQWQFGFETLINLPPTIAK
ncbi:uncharacterized protein G2W53_040587 [Senna tora]|uniref:Uncharacterized protein n=1 Tax=Senna tora TaxID=362788 RepID=A0A834SEB3_9FABA|nr:uncharacterized protein G2W53_040587 [Senna tora]